MIARSHPGPPSRRCPTTPLPRWSTARVSATASARSATDAPTWRVPHAREHRPDVVLKARRKIRRDTPGGALELLETGQAGLFELGTIRPGRLQACLLGLDVGLDLRLRQLRARDVRRHALASLDQEVRLVARGRPEVAEDVFDEARPQVALDVVPGVELDLRDVLVDRQVALGRARRPRRLGDSIDPALESLHEEALAGAPIAEQADGQRGDQRAGGDEVGEGVDLRADADEVLRRARLELAVAPVDRRPNGVGVVAGDIGGSPRPGVGLSQERGVGGRRQSGQVRDVLAAQHGDVDRCASVRQEVLEQCRGRIGRRLDQGAEQVGETGQAVLRAGSFSETCRESHGGPQGLEVDVRDALRGAGRQRRGVETAVIRQPGVERPERDLEVVEQLQRFAVRRMGEQDPEEQVQRVGPRLRPARRRSLRDALHRRCVCALGGKPGRPIERDLRGPREPGLEVLHICHGCPPK